MIIFDGNGEAISFNDDRSLDSRFTGRVKVYINGQVDRLLSLDWFYKLLALFPDLPGELKSGVIVAKFKNLPTTTQSNIWRSLRRVRIHIVDPRPYCRRADDLLRGILKDDHAPVRLRQMTADGSAPALFIASKLREMVCDSLLNDSTAFHVQWFGRALASPFSVSESPAELSPFFGSAGKDRPLLTIGDFGHSGDHHTLRNIAQWSAKASAAFHSALDAVMNGGNEDEAMMYRFDMGRPMRMRMVQELRPSHAFDKGNARHLELLERSRSAMIDEFSANDYFFSIIAKRNRYVEVESSKSYYVQAADFAAGIASDIFASEKLIGVVRRFEYVTFNGKRVSIADAEEELRKERRYPETDSR